jgi:hypothetical protein
VVVCVVLVSAGVGGLWLVARGAPTGRAVGRGAALAAAVTLVLTVVQHGYFPDPPSPERHLPARAADYRTQLAGARGDVMVVGDVNTLVKADPSAVRELLDGSAWYLNPHRVQNTYTTIGNRRFRERFPYRYDGSTPPRVLGSLFATETTTGLRRVDLLGVSTLVVLRNAFPGRDLDVAPPGWRVAAEGTHAVTWVRRHPVPGAGHPVWTSTGTTVSDVSVDDRATRFVADAVPAGGGRVVLSALAWPGYRTDSGELGRPVDGYLVTVDLPAGAAGRTVTVEFYPPGWNVELACWWLAVVAGLAWSGLAWSASSWSGPALRRRRSGSVR